MCFIGVCHSNLVFVGERPDLHTPLQQRNKLSQLQNKKFEFTHDYLINRGKSSHVNESLMRVNNTSR